MRFLARALLLAALLAGPLAPPRAAAQESRIVAVVNGDIVTSADVDGRRRLFAITSGLPASPQVLDRLAPQITRLLIDERLRQQEVQRRRGVVADEDIAAAIADLERRNNAPPGSLVAQLREAGVPPRVLYDQLRAQIGWSRLVRALLGRQATPTEDEINDWVANQRARTGQPEFLVSEIFIPLDDPGEEADVRRFVNDIVGQLRAGSPFPIVATQFSQAQSALQGGDMGWVGTEALDPEVARIVTQMPPARSAAPSACPAASRSWHSASGGGRARRIDHPVDAPGLLPLHLPLNPDAPTGQQVQQLERARALGATARSCEQMEAAARTSGSDRPADPGEVREEQLNPPPLRALIASSPRARPASRSWRRMASR